MDAGLTRRHGRCIPRVWPGEGGNRHSFGAGSGFEGGGCPHQGVGVGAGVLVRAGGWLHHVLADGAVVGTGLGVFGGGGGTLVGFGGGVTVEVHDDAVLGDVGGGEVALFGGGWGVQAVRDLLHVGFFLCLVDFCLELFYFGQ